MAVGLAYDAQHSQPVVVSQAALGQRLSNEGGVGGHVKGENTLWQQVEVVYQISSCLATGGKPRAFDVGGFL